MINLLLVEDDRSLGATLCQRLQKEGYNVVWVRTREEAMQAFKSSFFDLCLFDIGLPDGSGLDLARDIRLQREVPFVFLTSMNSAEYRLEGYELGAAEFIPKPFFLKELFLLIRRVLHAKRSPDVIKLGNLEIDFKQGSLLRPDGKLEFPAERDLSLLKMLMQHSPSPVSRERIVKEVWHGDTSASERSVDNAVVRLRQLLREAGLDNIRSVRGVGYKWILSH